MCTQTSEIQILAADFKTPASVGKTTCWPMRQPISLGVVCNMYASYFQLLYQKSFRKSDELSERRSGIFWGMQETKNNECGQCMRLFEPDVKQKRIHVRLLKSLKRYKSFIGFRDVVSACLHGVSHYGFCVWWAGQAPLESGSWFDPVLVVGSWIRLNKYIILNRYHENGIPIPGQYSVKW